MKLLILSLFAVGSVASATVHECTDNRGRAQTLYTVVSVYNQAVVSTTTPGAAELGEIAYLGKAEELGRSANGDFNFSIVDKATAADVNWKKEKKCWKFVGPNY